MWRIAFAFLVTPPLAVIPVILVLDLIYPNPDIGFIATAFIASGFALTGYAAELIVAVPVVLLLRRGKCLSWWYFAIGGLACTFVEVNVLQFFATPIDSTPPPPASMVMPSYHFAIMGVLAGILFWLVAVFGNRALTTASTRTRETTPRAGEAGR